MRLDEHLATITRKRASSAFAALGAILALSCGSKGAVGVTATLHDPEAIVGRSSGLAALLTGGYGLHLALGPSTPSGADVSIAQGSFNLVTPDQATLVVLKFTTSPGAPFHLEPGEASTSPSRSRTSRKCPGSFSRKTKRRRCVPRVPPCKS